MQLKALLLAICALLCFTGCGRDNEYSGIVTTSGGNPRFFELETDDGSYGFVFTEETKLIWKDTTAVDAYKPQSKEDELNIFGCDMYVTVTAGDKTEAVDEYTDAVKWFEADTVTVTDIDEDYFSVSAKPVIYLYPEEEKKVSVKLEYNGNLFCTYPEYNGIWDVTAKPDGTLTDDNGVEYNYLYWEGITDAEYDFSEGFCVRGEDTAKFLEAALADLGLNRREANEFIVYWLPLMQENEYNIISFQSDAYTENAKLDIMPVPDTLIRVFMAYKPSDEFTEIQPQHLTAPERAGFTVIEWGGTQCN